MLAATLRGCLSLVTGLKLLTAKFAKDAAKIAKKKIAKKVRETVGSAGFFPASSFASRLPM